MLGTAWPNRVNGRAQRMPQAGAAPDDGFDNTLESQEFPVAKQILHSIYQLYPVSDYHHPLLSRLYGQGYGFN